MAFGAHELRVLRRALALALDPSPASAQDVQDCLRLAESVDEAVRESARLGDFLLADLARYRSALPGSLTGYLALLEDLLPSGYRPQSDDLAALGALRGNPRAARLLARCTVPAPVGPSSTTGRTVGEGRRTGARIPAPATRARLLALPGGRAVCGAPARCAEEKPRPEPAREPKQPSERPAPAPGRPVPTPAEVFPPRRRPARPAPEEPAKPPQERAAG
ncbi:hypothetical protein HUT18_13500 [Streptomyces sp. NA04227]|nr:hypothetical protein HUT18_13500 [Streptomyces sp. NA04227]